LVAIDQGLVLRDGVQQRSCLLGQGGVGVLSEHGSLGPSDRRGQQAGIPKDETAPGHERQNVFEAEVLRHAWRSRSRTSPQRSSPSSNAAWTRSAWLYPSSTSIRSWLISSL